VGKAAKSYGEDDTAHADGRAACVCVNQRPGRQHRTGEAGRERSEVRWIWRRGDPPEPESSLQMQVERIRKGHLLKGQSGNPAGPDRPTSTLVKATAARVKRSVCTRLNQFGSITGKRHENGVRSQANVRVKAHGPEMRSKENLLPSRMTARHPRPAGTDRDRMREMRMVDQLIGAEGGFSRSGNPAASSPEFSTIRRGLPTGFAKMRRWVIPGTTYCCSWRRSERPSFGSIGRSWRSPRGADTCSRTASSAA
jgi:hypothetical protein